MIALHRASRGLQNTKVSPEESSTESSHTFACVLAFFSPSSHHGDQPVGEAAWRGKQHLHACLQKIVNKKEDQATRQREAANRAEAGKAAAEKEEIREQRKHAGEEQKRADEAITAQTRQEKGDTHITEAGVVRIIHQQALLVSRGKISAKGEIMEGSGGGHIPTNVQLRPGGGLAWLDDLMALLIAPHTLPPSLVMHNAARAELRTRIIDKKCNFMPISKNSQKRQATLTNFKTEAPG